MILGYKTLKNKFIWIHLFVLQRENKKKEKNSATNTTKWDTIENW